MFKILWFSYWKAQNLINTTLKWGKLFAFWAYPYENQSNFTMCNLEVTPDSPNLTRTWQENCKSLLIYELLCMKVLLPVYVHIVPAPRLNDHNVSINFHCMLIKFTYWVLIFILFPDFIIEWMQYDFTLSIFCLSKCHC